MPRCGDCNCGTNRNPHDGPCNRLFVLLQEHQTLRARSGEDFLTRQPVAPEPHGAAAIGKPWVMGDVMMLAFPAIRHLI